MDMKLLALRDQAQADLVKAEGWMTANRAWLIACAVCFFAGWAVAGFLYH